MRFTVKSSRFTYKSLLWYSLAIIALLLLAVPVLANNRSGSTLLDFSRSTNTGMSVSSAQQLATGINVNHLNPGQENWYTFSRSSLQEPALSWMSMALRYESEALLDSSQMNFEVFSQPQGDSWFQSNDTPGELLGNGLVSPLQNGDRGLVETFWTGHIAEEGLYYVRVFNSSPFGLDYTLDVKAEQPAVSGAMPASLNESRGNAIPRNVRQMAWTLTAQAVINMPADEAATWMKTAQEVGWLITEGTAAENIPDPAKADPELLWQLTAQAVAGQDATQASEWLIQADSMGWLAIPFGIPVDPNETDFPEPSGGGEGSGESANVEEAPAVPAPPDDVYAPVNIYPNQPLPFDFNEVNSGRLAPYGEHWYELRRDDLDDELIENMKMTMFFTPIQGYHSNRVNFEIFPAGQYHIWQRGDSNYMENMGLGMWVSRDEDPHTGERLWNGTLVDGDRYLVKVKNGTAQEVDYYLYPDDIENSELGNPTLHTGSGIMETISYSASPATRPARPPEPGENPVEALSLNVGNTTGELAAGQEVWYKFRFHDRNDSTSPEHDFELRLISSPLNSVLARHADFAIYPGSQFHLWTRGTIDELEPMGTSSPTPYRTQGISDKSLEVLWHGNLMEDQEYYIKVFNHDIGPLQYELEFKGGP
jgi:hypothetical protein